MRREWPVSFLPAPKLIAQRAAPVALAISCLLVFAAASPPQTLRVSPNRLRFTETQGAGPKSKSLSISLAPVSRKWTVTTDVPWLEVTPSSGLSTEILTASVDLRNLLTGNYHATIAITPSNGIPATVPVDLTVKPHPVLRTYSVIELGKLLASLTGILAGFALTVAILLIERSEEGRAPELFARSSIVSFFVAFATSLETAFNFAVIGAETENSVRLAVQLIPVAFGLSMCIAYLFMGIVLALFEYRIAEHMRVFTGLFCSAALCFLGLNTAFSTLWSVAVWEERKIGELTAHSPEFSYGLLFLAAVPAVLIAIRIFTSRKVPPRRSRLYIPIAMVSLLVVTVTSVLASFIADAVPIWMQENMRWVGGITVVLYVLVSGGAAASLPSYERRSPPSAHVEIS